MAVSVVIWQLMEFAQKRQLCYYIFQNYFYSCEEDTLKTSDSLILITEKFLCTASFHTLPDCLLPQANTYQVIWSKIFFLPHTLKLLN
jgi:hypothetical protein